MLNFITDGTPGRTLPDALHWFGVIISDPTLSRFTGYFVLIVLGGIVWYQLWSCAGKGSFQSVARFSLVWYWVSMVGGFLATTDEHHEPRVFASQSSVWHVPCHFSHRSALRDGVGFNLLSTTGEPTIAEA